MRAGCTRPRKTSEAKLGIPLEKQRILGIVMGFTFPNHHSNSYNRNPTFYYLGPLDPVGEATAPDLRLLLGRLPRHGAWP